MSNYNALRAIANRLTSSATEDLVHQVGFISTSIASCSYALNSKSGDNAINIHKIRTKTSALLQDRTPEGRLSGIIITRALVEAGGIEFLGESSNWVRNLITCLNKPDAWETKRLCILTITRIYLLTKDHQALVREITTPTLPAFVTASLSASKPTVITRDGTAVKHLSPLLSIVLRSWTNLIQHFAPTFRPSVPAIKSICLSLLSEPACSTDIQHAASALVGRLHFCAVKNSGAVEWAQTYSQAIEAAHDTIDLAFRAIVEDWTATTTRTSKATRKQIAASVPASVVPDALGLDRWDGLTAGCQRLEAHLSILTSLLTGNHSQEVKIPFGPLLELTSRLSAITPPTPKFSLRTNNEVTRDEREELWLNLPRVHLKLLELFVAIVIGFSQALFPIASVIAQQAWDIFASQTTSPSIKTSFYQLLGALLNHRLLQIDRTDSANFKHLISSSCADIKHFGIPQQSQTIVNGYSSGDKGKTQVVLNLEQNSKRTSGADSTVSDLYAAAWDLLPILLEHVPFHVLSGGSSLRVQIDSQVILSQHHEALLASVLYPLRPPVSSKSTNIAVPTPTLLPFIAQTAVSSQRSETISMLGVEALLRPRFPVIESLYSKPTGNTSVNDEDSDSDGTQDETDLQISEDVHMISDVSEVISKTTMGPRVEIHTAEHQTAPKRDFTAILEASADAQLAASAANEPKSAKVYVPGVDESLPAFKRQRFEGDAGQIQTYAASSPSQSRDMGPREGDIATGPVSNTDASVQWPLENDIVLGKAIVTVDEESDTDSDIPPIDATLVVMTDSEDEVDG